MKKNLITLLFAVVALDLTTFVEAQQGSIQTSIQASVQASIQVSVSETNTSLPETNLIEELDPNDPNIEEVLRKMDLDYFLKTGQLPFIQDLQNNLYSSTNPCQKFDCPVYTVVSLSEQTLNLYVNGSLINTWLVSTGKPSSPTPVFEGHPNGRIYDAYTSSSFPGGDYQGLGNMPYAFFLFRGYAIHGTTVSNFSKLGSKASHGCVRLHPDNAKILNRLVRQYGIYSTWVSIVE